MSPSLDGTLPKSEIPQENNSSLTLYMYVSRFSQFLIFLGLLIFRFIKFNQWEHCGVVVRALDLQSKGRGFESHSVRTPLDKAFCPQLSLSTQV